jgi:hypothetical protein
VSNTFLFTRNNMTLFTGAKIVDHLISFSIFIG